MTRIKHALAGTDWATFFDDLNAGLQAAVICIWLSVGIGAWWLA